MPDPLISVLIPAYHRADTIAQYIDSAQAGRHDRMLNDHRWRATAMALL